MGKKALRKDLWTEIRKSRNRFVSIFLIVALGVAFFSGVRAAQPDMRMTGDAYFDKYHLMDLRVVSTLGFSEENIEAIRNVEGVEMAEPSYMADVLHDTESSQMVLQFLADSDQTNETSVIEGRMPEKEDECLIDASVAEETGYQVGDTIQVHADKDADILDTFVTDTFTITGIGANPLYVSFERGSTTVGSGQISGFVIVPPESFSQEAYTQVMIQVEGASELESHTDEYNDLVEQVQNRLEDIADVQCQNRYDALIKETQEQLEDARKELEDGEQEAEEQLAQARQKLDDGYAQLESGRQELESRKAQLADAESQISENEQKLEEARQQLETGRQQLEAARAQVSSGEADLAVAQAQVSSSEVDLKMIQSIYPSQLLPDTDLAQQLADAQAQLEAGKQQLAAAQAQIDAGKAQIAAYEQQIETGTQQIADGEAELAEARQQVEDARPQIEEAEQQLEEAEAELADGETEYADAKAEAEAELADAREQIADGEEQLSELEVPTWYLTNRNDLPGYEEFGSNADRVGAIGNVFPVIFFLVAALVSLTTMTRMVEEQRVQIGTLKALGYSKAAIAFKYIVYALLATIGGSAAGVLFGEKVFPWVIIYAYKIIYPYMDTMEIPYRLDFAVMASGLALLCTLAATILSCYKELAAQPAQLMRPAAPKQGKRVLLERIGFLWRHLNFTQKSTCRNLFRYKKRFFMTVFGIGSCMALLIVGFGLRDSIVHIADIQYAQIQRYDGMLQLHEDASEEEMDELYQYLDGNEEVDQYVKVSMKTLDAQANGETRSPYVVVPQSAEDLKDFIVFQDRKTKEVYSFDENSVMLTEQLADHLGVGEGDQIQILSTDGEEASVTVTHVVENYMMHYIYMAPQVYENAFGESPDYSMLLIRLTDAGKENQESIGRELLNFPAAFAMNYVSENKAQIENMLGSLNIVIVVLILSAGMLAFVVLYNLNNININERRRELATLKVLGFYDPEVAAYVYRENIILTVLGALLGVGLGAILHRFIIVTVEVDQVMFSRTVSVLSYLLSAGLTCVFSAVVNYAMYFKLKAIDMVESLKSIE